MARPLRIEFSGALYHVTSRGDRKEDIYQDDADRKIYLGVLGEVCERFNWVLHAYCLMDNHYHLLVETPDGNLAKGMRHLNGVYTQRFNARHKRVGHVFQGRYKAILVQKKAYLLELARYIVLNPVRARKARSAKDWPWSSYRATAGLGKGPMWLHSKWILSAFSRRKGEAIKRYRAFVSEGKNQPSPWEQLKNQIYLGSASFVEKMQRQLDSEQDLSEIPSAQRRPVAKPLEYFSKKYHDRDTAIVQAYASGGYSMKEIGAHFGLHYSRISRIIRAADKT
ncbi:transposase [Nitrosococcus wardiae]|uniref:Addiction module toxin RelE n=1 Tax=Nitrosococcus wardiae TaxID=1814290 RepID=A0A4P7BXL8_9GAMM|nr:transposase [Nitrosococcus wardiae]QBQ54057.1 addiction module toxin RelE [Nitrosococcus wardiae]